LSKLDIAIEFSTCLGMRAQTWVIFEVSLTSALSF